MSHNWNDSASSLADTIQVISLENLAERNLAAGDGCQIKYQSTEDTTTDQNVDQTDAERSHHSMEDHAELDAKPSSRSTYSNPELEQRWMLRLQKLAEFENSQSERSEGSGGNGDDIETKPKTWQQYWQEVQQETSQSADK